jgi:hypothetical protein
VFLESYSYRAARPVIDNAVGHLLDSAPPLAPELASLVTTVRTQVRPTSVPSPAARPRVPAGSGYDLVLFWKQNDTGIYGRRQDMFLKYLTPSAAPGSARRR